MGCLLLHPVDWYFVVFRSLIIILHWFKLEKKVFICWWIKLNLEKYTEWFSMPCLSFIIWISLNYLLCLFNFPKNQNWSSCKFILLFELNFYCLISICQFYLLNISPPCGIDRSSCTAETALSYTIWAWNKFWRRCRGGAKSSIIFSRYFCEKGKLIFFFFYFSF